MHTVVEVAAAVCLFVPLSHYRRSWALLRDGTERLANSWHEWRAGPVRIINHGLYAGLAAFTGALLVGMLPVRLRRSVGNLLLAVGLCGWVVWGLVRFT